MSVKAYLQVTMRVEEKKRAAAANVYTKYRELFLTGIIGAVSKALLIMPRLII